MSPAKQDDGRKPGTWKPGQSGNPKGRARVGNTLAECMREYLESKDKGLTRKQRLSAKLYSVAMGDNCVPATRLIMETLGLLDIEARLTALEGTLERIEADR
jgi:hypothetical protein